MGCSTSLSWWKLQVKRRWRSPGQQRNVATGGRKKGWSASFLGKGLCSQGTWVATEPGTGRWQGPANSQKADGGGECYVPEASKDSVGVYEGDANSHFQE